MEYGSFEEMIEEFKSGVYDFTKDGKCIECGECCSRFLAMSQKEIRQIKAYIKENNIKQQLHAPKVLSTPTIDWMCPFLDVSKKNHKCTIYKVRPYICREFCCNCWTEEKKKKEFARTDLEPVDVIETFFPGTQDLLLDDIMKLL